jgi:hypothetical protein
MMGGFEKGADGVIACSLEATDLPQRVAEWRALLAHVIERTPIENGVRVRFGPGIGAAAVADLADRERGCCAFFEFSIHLARGGVTLDVRAPAEAKALVDALFEVQEHTAVATALGKPASSCGCGDKDQDAEQAHSDAE